MESITFSIAAAPIAWTTSASAADLTVTVRCQASKGAPSVPQAR